MKDTYTVYLHTFPNGKKYIGITYRKPEYRWNNGKNYRSQEIMRRAIEKYGWENITHEILFEHLTKEEAEQKEIELIAQYKSNQRKYGYNIENGGNSRGAVSEKTKIKISKNNARYWKGKKLSLETRKKISQNQKGRKISKESIRKALETKKKNYPNGIHVSKENRLKSSQRMKGNKLSAKPIMQLTKDLKEIKIWSCISDASRELKINNGSIVSCAKGKRPSAGGYIWKYILRGGA